MHYTYTQVHNIMTTNTVSYSMVLMMMVSRLNIIPIPRPISKPMMSVPVNTTNHTACARERERERNKI